MGWVIVNLVVFERRSGGFVEQGELRKDDGTTAMRKGVDFYLLGVVEWCLKKLFDYLCCKECRGGSQSALNTLQLWRPFTPDFSIPLAKTLLID